MRMILLITKIKVFLFMKFIKTQPCLDILETY